MRETFGSTVLNFIYDADGRPFAMEYSLDGGTTVSVYYYVLNLQGDVMRLITASGDIRADYSYGPYGETKVLDINGNEVTNPNSIGMLNPLRYRSYYCDNETGFYYVSSRYYDPEIGRFINADDVDYLGADGSPLSYSLFAYCKNNPVNGYDPSGTFDWGSLTQGGGWLATGVAALVVGVSVLTCGVATPLMVGVALATAGAGALTAVNGASEIGEAFTGYNAVRDGVFQGNATAYNAYAYSTAAVAQIGTAICGGWSAKNAPRIKAYNNIENYNYTNTISDATHMSRPYANSVLMQQQVIKYGEMTTDSFGYVFSAMGSVNGKEKLWRLGVNTAKELVWHWGHGF